jgi:DNA-binding NarL/FixJ family response regulator
MRPNVVIHDLEKDEIIEREMNPEEYAEYFETVKLMTDQQDEAEAKATARASALAKLAALGLSADEIAAL